MTDSACSSKLRRLTIFDLPGELRNQIFENLLLSESTGIDEETMNSVANAACFLGDAHRRDRNEDQPGHSSLQDLASLSLVCRQIRDEVQSPYFSRNRFFVTVSGMGRLPQYLRFLQDIGQDGRARLTFLALQRSGGPFQPCSRKSYNKLFRLLGECTNLVTPRLSLHLEAFLHSAQSLNDVRADAYPAIKSCLYGDEPVPEFGTLALTHVLRKLSKSGRLKHFSLECVYEMRMQEVQERGRWLHDRKPDWKESVSALLLPQLRAALPKVEVSVEVKCRSTTVSAMEQQPTGICSHDVEADNRL